MFFSNVTEKQRKSLVLFAALLIPFIVALSIGRSDISAGNDRDLAREAVKVDDLFSNSRLTSAGYIEADSPNHPLSTGPEVVDEARPALHAYKRGYSSLTFAPEEEVAIASFLYQYSTPAEAIEAADTLGEQLGNDSIVTTVDHLLQKESG